MSEDKIIPFNTFKLSKDQELIISSNRSLLKNILEIFLSGKTGDNDPSVLASTMVENLSLDDIQTSLEKFSQAFSDTTSLFTNKEPVPHEFVPFENDPPRFLAWSLIATGLHPKFESQDVANALKVMKTLKVNEFMTSIRDQFITFLNDSENYENVVPISEAPEEDGFTAEVLVAGRVITGHFECGYTWGWVDENSNQIRPTHFIRNIPDDS